MGGPGRFVDAILIARDFFARYPTLQLPIQKLHPEIHENLSNHKPVAVRVVRGADDSTPGIIAVLDAARANAEIAMGVENYLIKVKALSESDIKKRLGTPLLDENGNPLPVDRVVRSILEYRTGYSIISYVDTLNACWTRFVVCKEIAHVIMGDKVGKFATNLEEQLQMAFEIGSQIDFETDLKREMFAWCLAMEIMLPWSSRSLLTEAKETGLDHLELARLFWVPRKIIDVYFDTRFGRISEEANKGIVLAQQAA